MYRDIFLGRTVTFLCKAWKAQIASFASVSESREESKKGTEDKDLQQCLIFCFYHSFLRLFPEVLSVMWLGRKTKKQGSHIQWNCIKSSLKYFKVLMGILQYNSTNT